VRDTAERDTPARCATSFNVIVLAAMAAGIPWISDHHIQAHIRRQDQPTSG